MELLIPYLVIMNAASFLLMLSDKQRAKRKLWRIPEATLLAVAALGGSLGALVGMETLRHKTNHYKFVITIPLFMVVHLFLLLFFIKYR